MKQLLSKWGVDVGNSVVIDPERLYQNSPIIIPFYTNHAITKQLAEENRFPAMVFAVDLDRSAAAEDPDWGKAGPLLRTSESAWGETGRLDQPEGLSPQGKQQKEFNLAYAVERTPDGPSAEEPDEMAQLMGQTNAAAKTNKKKKKKPVTRLAVIGDADFIVNGYLANFAGSKDFFLNTINWTLGREENITIRPKDPVSFPMNLTEQQMTLFFIIAVVLMPLAVIASGVMVFLQRRKHGK